MITIKGTEYKVRALGFDDLEPVSRIFEKADIDISKYEDQAGALTKGEKADFQKEGTKLFLDLIGHVLKNYHKAHKDIVEFVASLIEVDVKEVKKMPVTTPFKVFKELAKDEEIKDFLDLLSQ